MTPAQTRGEIDRLINALFSAKVAIDFNSPMLLSSHGSTIVTWSNEVTLSTLFDLSSSFDIYLETLRRRWFTVVLFDGSLLQFSYTFAGNVLKKHRLCFMPCPIHIKASELGFFGLEELVELIEGHEFKERVRLEGPLRFDYDSDAGSLAHPSSHLTISRVSCRVPVSAPLSVGHFVRFLFSHFYPQQWSESEEIRSWACSSWDNCLPELEDDRLFVSWKRPGLNV